MAADRFSHVYAVDHGRLDDLFDRFRSRRESEPQEAAQCFQAFKRGLEEHIRWEEELLFPLFEAKTGMTTSGPTVVMRFEHGQIRALLNVIDDSLRRGAPMSDDPQSRLGVLLEGHNRKEETVLYPMLDQFATAEERERIFRQMAGLPLIG